MPRVRGDWYEVVGGWLRASIQRSWVAVRSLPHLSDLSNTRISPEGGGVMGTNSNCARLARRRATWKSGIRRSAAEALESRRLLTTLTINGTSGPDTIDVSTNGITITVVNDGATAQF